MSQKIKEFVPLNICVLTVSDTRNEEQDTSGQKLVELLQADGHKLYEKTLIKDDVYHIRAVVSQWIFDSNVQAIVITGGTSFAGRDNTPQAVVPLFDHSVDGFGELFRQLSYEEIGTSTIQSRAVAGLANKTVIFCLPGSTGACVTGWQGIISSQLNATHRPCNFVGQLV
ncbi:molybdenum cofactor biosynthesis protein B [Saccharophagus degradans]|uniref:molybdenum cofactor biosynthesis protein B n=1 Tax=Saccharophagus degradans TaxID=86304 RepID=UPI003A80DC07